MNYYSSGNQSSPYSRRDAYSRASRYRSRPSAVETAANGFDIFGTDFSDSFGKSRAQEIIFKNAAKKAEDRLTEEEQKHRLKMQDLTHATQKKTYGIVKKKAEEAAKKAQRRNTGSSIGSLIGGGIGLLATGGNPVGGAFGSQAGEFIGGLFG